MFGFGWNQRRSVTPVVLFTGDRAKTSDRVARGWLRIVAWTIALFIARSSKRRRPARERAGLSLFGFGWNQRRSMSPVVLFTGDRAKTADRVAPGWLRIVAWTIAPFIA